MFVGRGENKKKKNNKIKKKTCKKLKQKKLAYEVGVRESISKRTLNESECLCSTTGAQMQNMTFFIYKRPTLNLVS